MAANSFVTKIRQGIIESYVANRPLSNQLFKKAGRFMPGGDTRSVTFFNPFPSFMKSGKGCVILDVDGNRYIDFLNNYTSLIHGHAHEKTVSAVMEQCSKGSVFASPVESQIDLAKNLCNRIRAADKVRFCNSGTEATMAAIRFARAFTKKYKVVKAEGGYHGSHDLAEISVKPDLAKAGPVTAPYSVPEDASIPPNVIKDCITIPFNELSPTQKIIDRHKDELAAVIIEPLQGSAGIIPGTSEFLRGIREITRQLNIPLIFDEVMSFRLSEGGCQEIYDIDPDITALGKIIGGGYPVGAVAGYSHILELSSPLKEHFLPHSGTFNGNPVTMVAGLATLKDFPQTEIDRINSLGKRLREGFREKAKSLGLAIQVTGMGSLTQIHFTPQKVTSWRGAARANLDIRNIFHLSLLEKGIFPAARGMFNISTPMGESEIDMAVNAVESTLENLLPYIEAVEPQILL